MSGPVETKEQAIERILIAKEHVLGFGVANLGLFGSFVTGKQTAKSDVDILVEFAPGQRSFDNFMDLSFFLEELLGREVELVAPEALSLHIGPHIREEVERVPVAA